MKLLQDKVCIVTGAGRGIGRAIALLAAENGCRTVLASRSADQLEAVQAEILDRGGQAFWIRTDLSRQEDLAALVQRTLDRFGSIDFLVNNAGWGIKANVDQGQGAGLGADPPGQPVGAHDPEPARPPHPHGEAGRRRRQHRVDIGKGRAGRVRGLCRLEGRAHRLQPVTIRGSAGGQRGIKVAVIVPGFVDTGMIPPVRHLDRARMIMPEDVAQAVLFVLTAPPTACPVEITVRPQRTPYR